MANNEEPVWAKIGLRQGVDDLIKYGPTIRAAVRDIASKPNTVSILAQIDTGAAMSGVSPDVVRRLQLRRHGSGDIVEAGRERITVDFHEVDIIMALRDPPSGELRAMSIRCHVAGLPSLAKPHDLLIGRDILGQFRLLVDFTTGTTQLHLRPE